MKVKEVIGSLTVLAVCEDFIMKHIDDDCIAELISGYREYEDFCNNPIRYMVAH